MYHIYGLTCYEIERIDSGYRSTLSVPSSLVMVPVYEHGGQREPAKDQSNVQDVTWTVKTHNGSFL